MLSSLMYTTTDAFEGVVESKVWGKTEDAIVNSLDVINESLLVVNSVLKDIRKDIENPDPAKKAAKKAMDMSRMMDRLNKTALRMGISLEELLIKVGYEEELRGEIEQHKKNNKEEVKPV